MKKIGDRITVDLSGLYLAMCEECEHRTLMVPNGFCSNCQEPESKVTWLCDLGPEDLIPVPNKESNG